MQGCCSNPTTPEDESDLIRVPFYPRTMEFKLRASSDFAPIISRMNMNIINNFILDLNKTMLLDRRRVNQGTFILVFALIVAGGGFALAATQLNLTFLALGVVGLLGAIYCLLSRRRTYSILTYRATKFIEHRMNEFNRFGIAWFLGRTGVYPAYLEMRIGSVPDNTNDVSQANGSFALNK